MTINPWLASKLKEYRSRHSDEELRRDYEMDCVMGVMPSWEEYLQVRALYEAMRWDSFLQTLRENMELAPATRERLYRFNIDCVADLLQLSEEEIESCSIHEYLDLKSIKKYLKKHGYKFLPCAERTYKYSSLSVLANFGKGKLGRWMLNPPGSPVEFDITRPTLWERWFNEYYARHEHLEGEEKFQKEFADVRPHLMNGEMPKEYTEFFQAIGNLFTSYEAICISQHISPKFFKPGDIPDSVVELKFFPNKRFLWLWQMSCQTVIDIFERTNLFRHSSAGKFLTASLEQKLQIADAETHDLDFQCLLITIVEIRIDTEDIITFLSDAASSPKREEPTPVNPWLAERIMEYRHDHKEEYIRKCYVSYLDEDPDSSWADFLAVAALKYKIRRDPFLMTRRKDFGFSEHLTDVMNILEVEIVADLLQFTIEELSELCTQDGESVAPVVQFLAAHDYHILSCPENTLKYPLPEIEEERKQQKEVIRDHCSEAEARMKRTEEPLNVRLEHALAIYRSGLHLARACDLPLKTQLSVLIDMGRLMEEHIEAFPELAKDAPEIAERALYCSTMVHGPKGKKTAGCHRLYGAILSKLKRHDEAAEQYSAAAIIAKENDGPENIWVGKDLRSAAVCCTRIPDYHKALDLFFQAGTVFKKHPDEPHELEETYLNIAECYHQLNEKDNEQKYRLLAAAIRATDEI
ncbi:MAG: tetratricopeptide repeat protein [Bacteroidales bacterium]|nr:tetratricopeptide repeat protein [Bacteroidales bacterium]